MSQTEGAEGTEVLLRAAWTTLSGPQFASSIRGILRRVIPKSGTAASSAPVLPRLGCLSHLLLSPVYAQDGSDFMAFLPTGSDGRPTAQDERQCVRLQPQRETHCELMSLSHKQKGPGARAPA